MNDTDYILCQILCVFFGGGGMTTGRRKNESADEMNKRDEKRDT